MNIISSKSSANMETVGLPQFACIVISISMNALTNLSLFLREAFYTKNPVKSGNFKDCLTPPLFFLKSLGKLSKTP